MGVIRSLHAGSCVVLGKRFERNTVEYGFWARAVEVVQPDFDETVDPTFERGLYFIFDSEAAARRVQELIRNYEYDDWSLIDKWFMAIDRVIEAVVGESVKALVVAVISDDLIVRMWETLVYAGDPTYIEDETIEEIAGYIYYYSNPLIVIVHKWKTLDEIREEVEERYGSECWDMCGGVQDCYEACIEDHIQQAIKDARPRIGRVYALEYGELVTTNKCKLLKMYKQYLPAYEYNQLKQQCNG